MKISSCKRYSKIVITLVVLLFLIGTAGVSYPYCPDPHLSLEKEYASSAVVFVGKVLSERSTVEADGFYEGITYTLQVEEIFRGQTRQTTDIFSENSSGRFHMTVGSRYIVFGYSQGGRIQIDYCGHSGMLPGKISVLDKVRALHGSEICITNGKFDKDKCTQEASWIAVGTAIDVHTLSYLQDMTMTEFTLRVTTWDKGTNRIKKKQEIKYLSGFFPGLSSGDLVRVYGYERVKHLPDKEYGVYYVENLDKKE